MVNRVLGIMMFVAVILSVIAVAIRYLYLEKFDIFI